MKRIELPPIEEPMHACHIKRVRRAIGKPISTWGPDYVNRPVYVSVFEYTAKKPRTKEEFHFSVGVYSYTRIDVSRAKGMAVAEISSQFSDPQSAVIGYHSMQLCRKYTRDIRSSHIHANLIEWKAGAWGILYSQIDVTLVSISRIIPPPPPAAAASLDPNCSEPPCDPGATVGKNAPSISRHGARRAAPPPWTAHVEPGGSSNPAPNAGSGQDPDADIKSNQDADPAPDPDTGTRQARLRQGTAADPGAPPLQSPGHIQPPSPVRQPRRAHPSKRPRAPTVKSYSKPDYSLIPDRQPPTKGRQVFAIESAECGKQGNWIVGYIGTLKSMDEVAGKAGVQVQGRYAANNYPGEVTPIDAGSIPAEEIEEACVNSLATCVKGGKSQQLCNVRLELCRKRNADRWWCDAPKKKCYATNLEQWWCVPRREFCVSKVRFDDWGGKARFNETIEFDTSSLYNWSDGLIPILGDYLTRNWQKTCGTAKSATQNE